MNRYSLWYGAGAKVGILITLHFCWCNFWIFVRISWNLHQMTTQYRGAKLRRFFWKFAIACHFFTKNDLKMPNLRQFCSWKSYIKSPIFKIFKKAFLTLLLYMVWSSGANFSLCGQKLKVLIHLAWNILKCQYCPFFVRDPIKIENFKLR